MKLADILKAGGIAVIPTDTLYGLVGCALNPGAVQRISELKQRSGAKPFIILIGDVSELDAFGVEPNPRLEDFWPGAVSVILPCMRKDLSYLHLGTNSLAFRLPKNPELVSLLKQTGPLVAPSSNPGNHPPALTIAEAKQYFGDAVDYYQDGGSVNGRPSRLIRLVGDQVEVLRN
jgi:L-threonylcarbamoyladenylate synthase